MRARAKRERLGESCGQFLTRTFRLEPDSSRPTHLTFSLPWSFSVRWSEHPLTSASPFCSLCAIDGVLCGRVVGGLGTRSKLGGSVSTLMKCASRGVPTTKKQPIVRIALLWIQERYGLPAAAIRGIGRGRGRDRTVARGHTVSFLAVTQRPTLTGSGVTSLCRWFSLLGASSDELPERCTTAPLTATCSGTLQNAGGARVLGPVTAPYDKERLPACRSPHPHSARLPPSTLRPPRAQTTQQRTHQRAHVGGRVCRVGPPHPSPLHHTHHSPPPGISPCGHGGGRRQRQQQQQPLLSLVPHPHALWRYSEQQKAPRRLRAGRGLTARRGEGQSAPRRGRPAASRGRRRHCLYLIS